MFEQFSPQHQGQPQAAIEILELHQIAQDFRLEMRYRQAFESYCRWYDAIAEQHRQELAAMQRDPDLLAWFRRDRA